MEQGFAATTVDAIAERAGVSRRSFFNYFDTKQAAAFPEYEGRTAWLDHRLGELPEVTVAAALELVVAEVRRFVGDTAHRHRYRLLLHIEELRDHDMRHDLEYEELLARHFLRSCPAPSAAEQFAAKFDAARIVGAYRAALLTWAHAEEGFDPATAVATAIREDRFA